ncbi:MAG: T9SS type A sorting domain-containing protein, partial [Flavicella sp.]
DAYWNTNQGARFFTSYTSESEKEKHLYNHKDYKFYDEGSNLLIALVENHSFEIFPNPVIDVCNVSFASANTMVGLVNLYSVKGDKLRTIEKRFEKGNKQFMIDLSDFSKGVYLLEITDLNGKILVSTQIVKV